MNDWGYIEHAFGSVAAHAISVEATDMEPNVCGCTIPVSNSATCFIQRRLIVSLIAVAVMFGGTNLQLKLTLVSALRSYARRPDCRGAGAFIHWSCTAYLEANMHKLAARIAGVFSLDSEKGVTAIEYGLIASLIAVAIIVAVTLVGTNLAAIFNYIASKLTVPS